MTRKKIIMSMLILILLIFFISLLFFVYTQNIDLNNKELLSNDEIVTLLEKHGCNLIETAESPIVGNDFANDSVLPEIYKIESSYDTYILIYCYDDYYNNANDVLRDFIENSDADREDYLDQICTGKNIAL